MRLLLLTIALVITLPAAAQQDAQPDARTILQRADELQRGDSQQGVYTMEIIRPDWQRSTRFEFWSEGADLAFIRVVDPAKDRGVAFLKRGREMWNYIPRVNRTIKIPPSMMLQSWMGSDFTNDDLVRESSIVDDYDARLLSVDSLEAGVAYRLELIPHDDAPVAWDRIEEWIRVEDYVPLRAEYYNERGEHVRTMLFEDIRRADDRVLPMRMTLLEVSRPGRSTVLQLDEVLFNRTIPARVFSEQNMRRGN